MFTDSTIYFATGLDLSRYIYTAHRNWDNYEWKDEVAANNRKYDEQTEDKEGFPDNLYPLYAI